MVDTTALNKEALRQQMLLRALFGDARPGVAAGWMRDGPDRFARGLQAYRANAGALAERALTAAFPTLAMLLGNEAMAGLARAHWRAAPPARGDIAQWGEALPAFIGADPQLADEPYLADVARLDWAVHQAEMAADAAAPAGLPLLAGVDPASLYLQMAPGTAVLSSAHPIVTIWQAHQADAADDAAERFAPVRAAFAAGHGENALVARGSGQWRAGVARLADADARFTRALLGGCSLGVALAGAGASFDFEPWLIDQLQHRRIAAVSTHAATA
jgi:Putative DNA-binding domain